MTKYNIKPDGSIGICNARHKCRYSKFLHVNANSPEDAQRQVDDFNKLVTTFQDQGKAMTETDIKVELTKQGKCLDILVYDKDESVRAEVADCGRDKDLDILVDDNSYVVRECVADFGRDKDLDKLRYDNKDKVRVFVAEKGRPQDREIFVKDHSSIVRQYYVSNCRKSDVKYFLDDEDEYVRAEAEARLSK